MAGNVLFENGKIKKISQDTLFAENAVDLQGHYLAPAFIDTHIHGYKGFGTDGDTEEDLLKMSLLLAARGVCAFCPTLYALSPDKLLTKLKTMSAAVGREGGAKIIGLHLEGPFISPNKLGAMKPEDISPIKKDLLNKIYDAANGHIASITAAPELENFDLLLNFCKEKNIVLQAGHTDATYEQMLSAKAKGLKVITHLFNAQSSLHHRAPGVAGAGIMEDFCVEVIADNVHLHPAMLGFIGRVKKPEDIILVTDSLTPTESEAYKFYANGERVEIKNGAWNKHGTDNIVGSSLTMIQAVKNLVFAGFSLENAVLAATANPARIHNIKNLGRIEEGYDSKVVVFDKDFKIKRLVDFGAPKEYQGE